MLQLTRADARLIFNFFKINLKDRYLASKLGGIWAILNPIIMLSIFTFIFGFVYKARLPGASTTLSYVIWLISGYGPWLAISEGLLNASNAIVSNSGVVKNMAFKTEILPISAVLISVVPLIVTLFFLLVLMCFEHNIPSWHSILVIPVLLEMYLLMFGLGFFLSAITVFLRDLVIVLPNVLMMILFMSPIFYTLSTMPRAIQWVSHANPFYILTEGFRQPLIYHAIPTHLIFSLIYVFILGLFLFVFGLNRFRKVKGYFSSVM